MKARAFMLNKKLLPMVDRKDISVLQRDLPAKREFVITLHMTPLQQFLYKVFLSKLDKGGKMLFAAYQALLRLWNHPAITVYQTHCALAATAKKAGGSSSSSSSSKSKDVGVSEIEEQLAPTIHVFNSLSAQMLHELNQKVVEVELGLFKKGKRFGPYCLHTYCTHSCRHTHTHT